MVIEVDFLDVVACAFLRCSCLRACPLQWVLSQIERAGRENNAFVASMFAVVLSATTEGLVMGYEIANKDKCFYLKVMIIQGILKTLPFQSIPPLNSS